MSGDFELLDAAFRRPRPKRTPVLSRRMRRSREGGRGFWHLAVQSPRLTAEEAEQIKASFLRAQRSGVVIMNDTVRIERIR